MTFSEYIQKYTSRKFLACAVAVVGALILIIGGVSGRPVNEADVQSELEVLADAIRAAAGAVLALFAALGYIKHEAAIDLAALNGQADKPADPPAETKPEGEQAEP